MSAGNFDKRVDEIGGHHLKSSHAQIVDEPIAFEAATWIPQYVTEWVLQYELVAQPFDVFPVDRIRRARCAVVDVYTRWPIAIVQYSSDIHIRTREYLHFFYTLLQYCWLDSDIYYTKRNSTRFSRGVRTTAGQ